MAQALTNACVLTEAGFHDGQTVLVEDDRIRAVMDDATFDGDVSEARDLKGAFLLPGFIDVQVNGGGGVLWNDAPTVESIRLIGEAHRTFGTTGFLPTLISDDLEKVEAAIEATREALASGVPGVLGLHLEGPFLSPEKKGAHDAAKFRQLDNQAIDLLASLGIGKTLVTLAPETTTPELIAQLVEAGVIVSAGHTNASYDEASKGVAAGITGFTHLFNAMSPLATREPGAVGAALDHRDTWCGIIADGYHVHPAALRIAIAAKGVDRTVLVTDAIPSVGSDKTTFELGGQTVQVIDGKCVTADGTLAGSHLDMASAVRNTVAFGNVTLAQAVRMASRNPAKFLGLQQELGRIEAGYRASFVIADRNLNVLETWIDGRGS